MKTPFPAILVETNGAPYFSATVRRCMVLELLPETRRAKVAVGTALNQADGFCLEIWVGFDQLASYREAAIAKASEAVATIITGFIREPAAAENPPPEKMAGVAAGSPSA